MDLIEYSRGVFGHLCKDLYFLGEDVYTEVKVSTDPFPMACLLNDHNYHIDESRSRGKER
jgi:hypothetical protein